MDPLTPSDQGALAKVGLVCVRGLEGGSKEVFALLTKGTPLLQHQYQPPFSHLEPGRDAS